MNSLVGSWPVACMSIDWKEWVECWTARHTQWLSSKTVSIFIITNWNPSTGYIVSTTTLRLVKASLGHGTWENCGHAFQPPQAPAKLNNKKSKYLFLLVVDTHRYSRYHWNTPYHITSTLCASTFLNLTKDEFIMIVCCESCKQNNIAKRVHVLLSLT